MIQQAMDGIMDNDQILPVTVLGTLIGKMEIGEDESIVFQRLQAIVQPILLLFDSFITQCVPMTENGRIIETVDGLVNLVRNHQSHASG
jgi:hypothetical protein